MSVLKGFSRLEVCFYIQNGLILKAFAFEYNSVLVLEILMVGWCEFACLVYIRFAHIRFTHIP